MSFAMRMTFVEVICDDSLKNVYVNGKKAGFEFDVRLGYYRGHYLSCIDKLEVIVDGEQVSEDAIKFGINGKEFSVCQLRECYTEFWNLLDQAKISVIKENGLSAGKHTVKLNLMLRVPYMSIGENHHYMPLDSSGEKVMEVAE